MGAMAVIGKRSCLVVMGAVLALSFGCNRDGGGQSSATTPATSTGRASTGEPNTGTTMSVEVGTSSGAAFASSSGAVQPELWQWDLPPGFPVPYVPEANPMSAAKVELGRHLFYDVRLSVNGTTSCATCHQQELAFTDGLAHAVGATGMEHPRGAMALANVGYASTLAWANPNLLELETHALAPMFGIDPVELGLVDEADVIAKISDDDTYAQLFAVAYPDQVEPLSLQNVTYAIASFERTLISGRAPFDRFFFQADEAAISESAKRGFDLFLAPFACHYCHFSFNYTDATYFPALSSRPMPFHNIGLYNLDDDGGYPEPNTGLFAATGEAADMGRFKAPTLRNIMLTAPYMHDGSVATIEEVVQHYADRGRTIDAGPLAGIGGNNPHLDSQMPQTVELSEQDMTDIVAFLESLTDDEFIANPDFGDPW